MKELDMYAYLSCPRSELTFSEATGRDLLYGFFALALYFADFLNWLKGTPVIQWLNKPI